ncbi:MAG TPA: JAB domain-containing protein [Erythrobacter sp.]|nr:JAB domain-containing protein [Erythrobacter sp.]
MTATLQSRPEVYSPHHDRLSALVAYLGKLVLAPEGRHECAHVIFVDGCRSFLGDAGVGMGSLGALSLRMREVFGEALRLGARGMILAHNHPSGDCRPSGSDIAATRRLAEVARALDIELIDHLIFTTDAVYSMRAGGLL